MDVFRAMVTFVRVVEAGSLSAAARDLNVSQPAISQQITALEQHLRVRLISRTTRQMALTEAGSLYYRKARAVIEAVAEAGEVAAGHSATLTGALRIQAPIGVGQSYIADVVVAFQQQHPQVIIDLVLDDRFVDLNAQAVDVAIRFGKLASSSLVARRLGTLRRIVVASPNYVAAHGSPEDELSLGTHSQVRFNAAPEGDAMPLIGPSGPITVPVRTAFMANNAFTLTKALVAGIGIGGAQLPLINDALKTGQLVRVMSSFAYAPLEVHAVYPSGRFIPAKVSTFVAFLEDHTTGIW